MKLNKQTLKRIIKEELEAVMSEGPFDGMRFDTSRKQDVGSYGWDTRGQKAQAQADAGFKRKQDSLQKGKDLERQMAFDKEQENDIQAAVRHILDGESMEYAMRQIGKNAEEDWEIADEVKKRVKAAKSEKGAKSDSNKKRELGFKIKTKVVPYLKKNAGSLWKKSQAGSKEEYLSFVEKVRKSDSEKVGASQKEIEDFLGTELYNSLLKGRTFGQKLKNVFTKGSFSQE